MASLDLVAYGYYRRFWQGTGQDVIRGEMASRYPESTRAGMLPVHIEILTRFAEATAGTDGVSVVGGDWAEDPAPRILEAIDVARMCGFAALCLGWSGGRPRLDVAWGDQVQVSPDTVRTLEQASKVTILNDNGVRTEYTATPGGWELGIATDIGSTPLAIYPRLPVLALYHGRSRADTAIPQPRRVLLDQQISIDMVATDIEDQRANSPTQLAVTGQDNTSRQGFHGSVNRGPRFIMELEQGEDIKAIPSSLNLSAQVDYLETLLQILAVTAGLSPTTFLPSRAETGAAKAEESAENTKVRRRNHKDAVAQATIISDWLSAVLGQPVAVTVPPFVVPSSGDPLQTASALDLRWRMGIDSPIEQVIAERGLTQEEAVRFVARNQASYRVFGGGTLTPEVPNGSQVAQAPEAGAAGETA